MHYPDTDRTIIAQATPQGTGAIAVLRLSGPRAFDISAKICGLGDKEPEPRRTHLLTLRDGDELIDRAIVVFYRAPNSYTGQDMVEFCCHGSPYIAGRLLNAAVKCGAETAGPGEFTLRAFLNGKMDLAQAEAVNALISAGTKAAHDVTLGQMRGNLSAEIKRIKDSLLSLLAELEVRLDDSYEEISALDKTAFGEKINLLKNKTDGLAGGFEAGEGLRCGIKAVIAGAPNTGKSSLLNALLGYKRAIVSDKAGTTRDTLDAAVDINGFRVILTDTAGLHKEGSEIEKEGIIRALDTVGKADIVILLKDASRQEDADDAKAERQAASFMREGAELYKVFNKSDLPVKNTTVSEKDFLISCLSGRGLDGLRETLVKKQRETVTDGSQPTVIFARHFSALRRTSASLEEAAELLKKNNPMLELTAECLRNALNSLGAITGDSAPDELLAEIFGGFCVGK